MFISPAYATNATVGTGSAGGPIALAIIIGAAITLLVAHVVYKKWRRRRLLRRETSGE